MHNYIRRNFIKWFVWKIEKLGFFKVNSNSKESVSSKDKQVKQYKLIKIRKNLKSLKNHREKMTARVNVRMPKIMRTPIKVGWRTDVTYANCWTLGGIHFLF